MNHRLTPAQFAESFADAKLNLFGVIEHLASVKTLQKDRGTKTPAAEIVPGGEVYKWQRVFFQALGDYETAVRNAQARDGVAAPAFDAEGHSWAKPFGDSKIIRVHKDWPERPGFYLQVRCPKMLPVKVEFRDRQGNILPFDRIAGILPTNELPAKKAAAREQEAAHQGVSVENLVVIRDYGVANIVRLSYCGDTYEVITEAEAAAEVAAEAAQQNAAAAREAVAAVEEGHTAARRAARAARRAAEAAENAARAAEAATATAEQIATRFEAAAREAAARFEAAAAPRPGTRQHVGANAQVATPAAAAPADQPAQP